MEAAGLDVKHLSSWVRKGISIPLFDSPPPKQLKNSSSVLANSDAVRDRLNDYQSFGAIVEEPNEFPDYIQPLHVVVKQGAKPRIVIDLSQNLNQFVERLPFTYVNIDDAADLSHPNCWYGKLDLSNAFLSFSMRPEDQKYLVFSFEDKLKRFTRLPFGLSSAPFQCTRLLSVPGFRLKGQGLKFVQYIDDVLFVAQSEAEMIMVLQTAISTLESFGLVINPSKVDGPSQRITFLGVVLDSTSQTFECTEERIVELCALLAKHQTSSKITIKQALSIIGKLSFAAKVLPGSRPFMRRMLDLIRDRGNSSKFASIRLSAGWRADARFWLKYFRTWNRRERWRHLSKQPLVFATDASITGYAFLLESMPPDFDDSAWPIELKIGSVFAGRFSECHKDLHDKSTKIAWSELFAVYAALKTFGSRLKDQTCLFQLDNETDCYIINRQSTRSTRIAGLLRLVFSECLVHNITLRAVHRSGASNIVADFFSRNSSLSSAQSLQLFHSSHDQSVTNSVAHVSVVDSLSFLPNNVKW